MKRLLEGLKGMAPEWQRDLLLDEVPALAAKYGDLAASAAAQWYEETRAQQVAGAYEALTADPFPDQPIRDRIRYGAGDLFKDDGDDVFAAWLEGALQRWVMYSGRQTIALNAGRDPARPRFARVPTGSRTCAWCEIMCSRGFVYYSEKTALERKGSGRLYHDHCDCQAVPEWDKERSHILGYDPDAMQERYLRAWEAAGGSGADAGDVAYQLRRLYPERYKDGIRGAGKKATGSSVRWIDPRPSGTGSFTVPPGSVVNRNERRAGDQLASMGFKVKANPIVNEQHTKNPDFTIGSDAWELKTPTGSGRNTIDNLLKKAGKQSSNVIIDLSGTSLSLGEVERVCRSRLSRDGTSLTRIMLIRDGRFVTCLERQ